MNPYQFLQPTLASLTSWMCFELAVAVVAVQWDPFHEREFPIGRVLLYWITLFIWCLWLSYSARKLWYA